MKQSRFTKLISLLLCVMLVMSLFPVSALAEGEESGDDTPVVVNDPDPAAEEPQTPAEEPQAPVAQSTEEPDPFDAGLVKLAKGTVLYRDEGLTNEVAILVEEGIVYAEQLGGSLPLKVSYTLDAETVQTAFCAANEFSELTEEETAAYCKKESNARYEDMPLLPLSVEKEAGASEEPAPEPTAEPTEQGAIFTAGLVRLAAGTVLYEDEALAKAIGTLAAEGIVYAEQLGESLPLKVFYTLDSANVLTAYVSADRAAALTVAEEAAYAATDSSAQYANLPLLALSFEAIDQPAGYTMDTYGFPGMPEGYQMSAEETRDKSALVSTGEATDMRGQLPNVDYVEGEVLLMTDSQEMAEQVAAAFGGKLVYWLDYGLTKIKLSSEHTVTLAITAAADPQTLLPAVYPNSIRGFEPPYTDMPDGVKNKGDWGISTQSGEMAPYEMTWKQQEILNDDPFIQDPDSTTHLNKRYQNITSGYQYFHDIVGTWSAWGLTKGSGAKVMVLDTGVLKGHTDFDGTSITDVKPSVPLQSTCGIYTAVNNLIESHGTHVAGIIAATDNNSKGGVGIAPNASIYAYRVTNSENDILTELIIDGLEKAKSNGVNVVNMSFGGIWYNGLEDRAMQTCMNAGVALFASAGNDRSMVYQYPSCYANIISVGSTDNNNARSWFSTYGSCTISAPGSYILSTAFYETGSPITSASTYQSYDGTSMACPVAVGCAALYYSARHGTRDLNGDSQSNLEDVKYLKNVLTKNVTKLNSSSAGMGAGIINIGKVFSSIVEKPSVTLMNGTVPVTVVGNIADSSMSIRIKTGFNGEFIVYTIDGDSPTIKNGIVTKGTVSHGTFNEAERAYLTTIGVSALSGGQHTLRVLNVNAQGKVSGVTTFVFKIDNSILKPGSRIEIEWDVASTTGVAAVGKSATFNAKVVPESPTLNKKIRWTVTSGAERVTKLTYTTTGVASLLCASPGTVTIRASITDSAGTTVTEDYDVNVLSNSIKTITLQSNKLSLGKGSTASINIAGITLSNGQSGTVGDYKYRYTSSKPSVATVNPSGMLTLISPGTTVITCVALDGSKVKATATVTVYQPVADISITSPVPQVGYYYIAAGKSIQITAVPTNADATNNKNFLWSLDAGALNSGVKISNGKLIVPASYMGEFTVTVRPTDAGSAVSKILRFRVNSTAASSLTIRPAISIFDSLCTWDKTHTTVTGVKLLTYSQFQYTSIQMTAVGLFSNAGLLWTSSNPAVATVDSTGNITALNAGKTTVTCALTDGSNKKAVMTVTVVVPCSSVNVYTNTDKLTLPYASIAFGKSRNFMTKLGDTYGKPTESKVKWSFELREYNPEGNYDKSDYLYDMENTSYFDPVTDPNVLKYVTISNGTLKINKYLQNTWSIIGGEYFVKIIATALDGSGEVGYTYAWLTPESFCKALSGTVALYYYNSDYDEFWLYSRVNLGTSSKAITLDSNPDDKTMTTTVYMTGYSWNNDFGSTSSNPSVASRFGQVQYVDDYYGPLYVLVGNYIYPLYMIGIKGDNPGSATVKIFTNDGTNKTASFSIKVKNP